MQTSIRRILPALALPLLTALGTAGDLYVGPPGSGARFTEISAALAQARAGDTIHVAAGTYGAFRVDLAVRIVGAGSSSVTIEPAAGSAGAEIRDIPAGAEATLSGMTFVEASAGSAPFVLVEDNAGNVVLNDLAGSGAPGGAFVANLVLVSNSAHVVLVRGSFTGEDATSVLGGVPLSVDGSAVWVSQSTLVAGAARLNSSSSAAIGGTPGIKVMGVIGGLVYLASSTVQGGLAGSWSSYPSTSPGAGGAGIFVESGAAILSGGPGNLVRGGDANPAGPLGPFGSRAGPAILTLLGGADYAADVVLEGGLELSGSQAPPVSTVIPSTVVAQTYARPVLSTSTAGVAPGGTFGLTFSGNALSSVGTFVALGTDPFLTIAGVDGPLVVDLASLVVGPSTTLDATGTAAWRVPVLAVPQLAGMLVVFQSIELGPQTPALSNPALVVIGS